jgi:AraC-like DNA-binding protein
MLEFRVRKMPGGALLQGHGHARDHLLVVVTGDLEQQLDSELRSLRSGSVRLSKAYARHQLRFGADGAHCLVVEAGGPFWSRVFQRALSDRTNAFAILPDSLSLGDVHRVEDLVLSAHGLQTLCKVLAAIAHEQADRPTPAWLEDAIASLHGGHNLPIRRIADLVRRDRVHFARAFARCLGLRPVEYRSLVRIRCALGALDASAQSLSEIAQLSGFSDQSHMTHCFRVVVGRSPGECRRRLGDASILQDKRETTEQDPDAG